MPQRLKWMGRSNKGVDALGAVEAWLARDSGLEHSLLHLVKMRASQINGCAFCLHMHSKDALAAGERLERLLLLDAWHETALYTARERAALGWTEVLTRVSETHAPEADYQAMREHFPEEEAIALSIAIAMINAWNRLSIGFRAEHPNDRARAA